jgi:GNAT superfamily N-acetyltransferase
LTETAPAFSHAADVPGMIDSMSQPSCADLIQLTDPGQVTPGVRQALVDCWIEVANAGGAVGFPFPPVDAGDVGPVADRLITDLDSDYNRVLLAEVGGVLAGWLSLSRHRDRVVPHWGTVKRVQTRPGFRGRGIGIALMNEARRIARDELGLEQLHLEARGGEGLEGFYGRLGWTEIGRWPGALRFLDGDRDEVLMLLAPL